MINTRTVEKVCKHLLRADNVMAYSTQTLSYGEDQGNRLLLYEA